jgi:hypothetical protein
MFVRSSIFPCVSLYSFLIFSYAGGDGNEQDWSLRQWLYIRKMNEGRSGKGLLTGSQPSQVAGWWPKMWHDLDRKVDDTSETQLESLEEDQVLVLAHVLGRTIMSSLISCLTTGTVKIRPPSHVEASTGHRMPQPPAGALWKASKLRQNILPPGGRVCGGRLCRVKPRYQEEFSPDDTCHPWPTFSWTFPFLPYFPFGM